MEALQQVISSQGQPATPEDAAKLARSGLLFFDNTVPMPTENSLPFVQASCSSLLRLHHVNNDVHNAFGFGGAENVLETISCLPPHVLS
jgi:hypothetical protein